MITIDTTKDYQVYFRGYVNSNNLKDGDTVMGYEYSSWIMQKHREFRKKKNLNDYQPYSIELEAEFIRFIKGQAYLKEV